MAEQLPLDIGLVDEATFEAFEPASNSDTLAALRPMARGRGEAQAYLWGPAGTGKSHLLQAVCHQAAAVHVESVYLPLAQLASHGPRVLNGLSRLAVIGIDHLDVVAGHSQWEQGLFQLLNVAREQGARLVFASRAPPGSMGWTRTDLSSRLMWGPVFRLEPLDDQGRLVALQRRAAARGLDLPEDAARYLLRHLPRGLGELMATLERLDSASLAAKRRITVPFVKAVLGL